MKPIQLGNISIQKVMEMDVMSFPIKDFFVNPTPDLARRGREALGTHFIHPTTEDIFLDFHSFVIQTGTRKILVDTCNGNHKNRPAPFQMSHMLNNDYLGNLARAGFRPEDIDVVLCTHLHFDHVGWNTRLQDGRWVPTFPNARYIMSKTEYEHFERESKNEGTIEWVAFDDSISPVVAAGQADLIHPGHEIERELGHAVWIESLAGHTPGSIALHVGAKDKKAIFSGDAIHHPLQIMDTNLHISADWDVAMAKAARHKLLESCADHDTLLMTAHFADPTAGRVVSRGGNFHFQTLSD